MDDEQKRIQEADALTIKQQLDSPMLNNQQPKRARDKDGKFIADDPSTPDYNEAWVGGKAPQKK